MISYSNSVLIFTYLFYHRIRISRLLFLRLFHLHLRRSSGRCWCCLFGSFCWYLFLDCLLFLLYCFFTFFLCCCRSCSGLFLLVCSSGGCRCCRLISYTDREGALMIIELVLLETIRVDSIIRWLGYGW